MLIKKTEVRDEFYEQLETIERKSAMGAALF
jgi:hypothetical protein